MWIKFGNRAKKKKLSHYTHSPLTFKRHFENVRVCAALPTYYKLCGCAVLYKLLIPVGKLAL